MGINLWFEQREIKVREGERGGPPLGGGAAITRQNDSSGTRDIIRRR